VQTIACTAVPVRSASAIKGSAATVLAQLEQTKPTNIYCFVFAWNIGNELLEKLREKFPSGTKVVQFMPEVSSVEL
jgi:hypothetical protein